MKTRVLTVSTLFPNLGRPGFGRFVARQWDALAATGEVDLVVINPVGLAPRPIRSIFNLGPAANLPEIDQSRAYPVHHPRFLHVPYFGARWNPGLIVQAIRPIAEQLHRKQPFDLVDAQFFYPDGPAAARIAKALDLPFSIKARGSDIHFWGGRTFSRNAMIKAAHQAAKLLAVSEALKADMVSLGMEPAKIAVNYTGLDHALFRPQPRVNARDALAAQGLVPTDGPLLVTPGNLIPLKGQSLVIEAMCELSRAQLLIAGSGPDLLALKALSLSRGLADRVHFATLEPADMALALTAADAMVLPSEREGLANVWIEALACGTPLVITDVGGAREVVTSPSAGRLVERTPAAIAAAVRDLLANPPAQAEVAAHAARFSWEANAAQLADHYRLVAGAAPSRARRS